MKNIKLITLLILATSMFGCKKFLDRKPLDASSASNFQSTQDEMEASLTGVYAASFWVIANNIPLLHCVEHSTDIAVKRGGNAEDQIAMGDGGPFLINNNIVNSSWNQCYRLVQRANYHLAGMENGRGAVSATTFGRIRAEALILRAWAYFNLMYMFGDVPYYRTAPGVNQVLSAVRRPVATIVAEMYTDLDEAVVALDAAGAQPILANGKVNKGAALAIKAKLAMLIKDYTTAAAATNTIITGGNYGLNPSYPNLFLLAGQIGNVNREILFNQTYPTTILDPQNWLAVTTVPRQVSTSQSSFFPSQALVDRYEDRSGSRIDASTTYNPLIPQQNRDRRLSWTVYMPGDTMVHNVALSPALPYINPRVRTIYNIYSNIARRYNWNTGVYDNVTGNNDWIGAQSAGIQWQVSSTGNIGGVGYVWRKYVDSTQYTWETKTGYILLRYADVLLTYAEAKIELNQIDGTVTSAMNAVRTRAGQPTISASSQAQMRQAVRRERLVELAGEGWRLFDLRRWGIYASANSGPIVGAASNPLVGPAAPSFDANEVPNYTASAAARISFRNQVRNNASIKYNLWPIPQFEIDANPAITQNPLW